MLILLIDLLKKIGGKKGKLLRFLHRVGLELEPAVELLQYFENPQAKNTCNFFSVLVVKK